MYLASVVIVNVTICSGKRTEWSPIQSVIIRVIRGSPIC